MDAQCTAFAGALVRRQHTDEGPQGPTALMEPGPGSCFPPASEFLPRLHHGTVCSTEAALATMLLALLEIIKVPSQKSGTMAPRGYEKIIFSTHQG